MFIALKGHSFKILSLLQLVLASNDGRETSAPTSIYKFIISGPLWLFRDSENLRENH